MGEENKGAPGGTSPDHPRREELDYYEIDLRDYLRVLWRGKWIVLTCFAIALGVSAFISFKAPNMYRAETKLMPLEIQIPALPNFIKSSTTENISQGKPFWIPSATLIADWAHDPRLVSQALEGDSGVSSGWVLQRLKAEVKGETVKLSLEGEKPPQVLERALRRIVEALAQRARERVREAIEAALQELEIEKAGLLGTKSSLNSILEETRSRTESQLQAIRQKLNVLLERGTTESTLQAEVETVYRRLMEAELFLDELNREGILVFPELASSYSSLTRELERIEAEKKALLDLRKSPPAPLEVIKEVHASSIPVGPNRKMNIAVAGVLGLFMGVLLAFLWNYLKGPEETPG